MIWFGTGSERRSWNEWALPSLAHHSVFVGDWLILDEMNDDVNSKNDIYSM
jgi:hypothetical protein